VASASCFVKEEEDNIYFLLEFFQLKVV
jgi:hypothetical protein